MRQIRRTLESAMREGLTLDEVHQIANIIAENLRREQEKEDVAAVARLKVAEALTEYVNLISNQQLATVEDTYELIATNDEFLLELFETGELPEKGSHEVIIEQVPLTTHEIEDIKTNFAELAKRLGF